jgi:carbon monoxide dehydrogenase subunit G
VNVPLPSGWMVGALALGLSLCAPTASSAQSYAAAPTGTRSVVVLDAPRLDAFAIDARVRAQAALRSDRSRRTIFVHTSVGAGAGLLIGVVLSAASVVDDDASVVVTWTAAGAAAGLASGVITWAVRRR